MTNKEVLDRMYAGEIFEDGNTLYKIKDGIILYKYKDEEWIESGIGLNELNLIKPHRPKQELPTWYKILDIDINNSFAKESKRVLNESEFNNISGDKNIFVKVISTCQALTKRDAVKEFYK
jgi:hypothetical protein